MILSWEPVLLNCQGDPEAVAFYSLAAILVTLLAWVPGPDGLPQPVYQWTDVGLETTETQAALPEPPPWGVLIWWPPVVVDTAGNTSEEPCP
jgi:hypothetical protein